VITISRPPAHKSTECIPENGAEVTFSPLVDDTQPDTDIEPKSDTGASGISESDSESVETKREQDRTGSLEKLQGSSRGTETPPRQRLSKRHTRLSKTRPRDVDAIIVLQEEKASTFHDFLKFAYPQ
jgi:hypothetical protein